MKKFIAIAVLLFACGAVEACPPAFIAAPLCAPVYAYAAPAPAVFFPPQFVPRRHFAAPVPVQQINNTQIINARRVRNVNRR